MEIRSSDKISSRSSPSSCSSTSTNLKETELRLGLPGSESPERKPATVLVSVSNHTSKNVGESGLKRGFSDSIDVVGSRGNWVLFSSNGVHNNGVKPANHPCGINKPTMKEEAPESAQEKKSAQVSEHTSAPANKAQVVGWPPIRSFRKNAMATKLAKTSEETEKDKSGHGCLFVKVSMDGAPYLRKVDLKTCKNYVELSSALGRMFGCFTIGKCGCEYVVTYEDKDGDWMLVGDVPWEMFTDTCRRLRIIKGSEAIGLDKFQTPRAMEKCKS